MEWKKTACILCECNCGIEVQLDGRELLRFRGDRAHPASKGYACEKPHRLNYYQNNHDRITQPLRRRADGSFEEISWEVAISEVAQRLAALRDTHGGDSIFYYGGGGQGNHLPGAYSTATRAILGSRYRSNALAQEKTGEFWVGSRMLGNYTRSDFEHCEVAFFLGKNPWHSHGIARARVTLKEIAKDPARTMIVVDPRRSKTAELADIHLQVKPGCDAWLMSALVAVVVQEDLVDANFVEKHCEGSEEVIDTFNKIPVAEYCKYSGVDEELVRKTARIIGKAKSVASCEDLGVQMNRHSTLVSYLHRLLWLLTGNFGKQGTQYVPTSLVAMASGSSSERRSPVAEARIIGGLVPCNVIAEEILSDHPKRYRGMIVEAANPAHSLADSKAMRKALRALDTLVVIDVAMTETAREADYVLPASTQFEKAEATFFNFEFPKNYFHVRAPILAAPDGPLSEAEIHARLCEALGAIAEDDVEFLRAAARKGAGDFAQAFLAKVFMDPVKRRLAPVLLYRSLGETLPEGLGEAAVLWGAAMQAAMKSPQSMARAGFTGSPQEAAQALFDSMIGNPSGLVFAIDDWEDCIKKVGTIQLALPDLIEELGEIGEPQFNKDFPFVLSAGERRSFTANTIVRDPAWRKKDAEGALRIHPEDAESLGIIDGGLAKLSTSRDSVVVRVEITDMMQRGHVSLPNGLGLDRSEKQGTPADSDKGVIGGVAPNELTDSALRDKFAGTPWHKLVPARVEAYSL